MLSISKLTVPQTDIILRSALSDFRRSKSSERRNIKMSTNQMGNRNGSFFAAKHERKNDKKLRLSFSQMLDVATRRCSENVESAISSFHKFIRIFITNKPETTFRFFRAIISLHYYEKTEKNYEKLQATSYSDVELGLYQVLLYQVPVDTDTFVSDTADNRSFPVGKELGSRQSGSDTRLLPWRC
ncbi:hypothetical protein AVEN_10136-1 [Araneus ventricosus]|uniref:Uncharacterized protein n=1 Tax=Araneus ventricosus TaxID=182803 RepID=A0A4Y2JYZ0_ARAVE|nr:hypothetical protein AVEN_10136-1 [Araneus ventricosus]